MTGKLKIMSLLIASAGMLVVAPPAMADGDIVCGSGPQENWAPLSQVRRKAWQQGWEVLRAEIEGDCYEVYARNEQGQAIEAFFHPETLEKLVVFRRGREIFRKDGFAG